MQGIPISVKVRIKENSIVAKIAAWKLGAGTMAITIGRTIYLHNTAKSVFLTDSSWVNHEVMHVLQFQKYGLIRFVVMYLLESIKRGYFNNKWEVEARVAEQGLPNNVLKQIQFV